MFKIFQRFGSKKIGALRECAKYCKAVSYKNGVFTVKSDNLAEIAEFFNYFEDQLAFLGADDFYGDDYDNYIDVRNQIIKYINDSESQEEFDKVVPLISSPFGFFNNVLGGDTIVLGAFIDPDDDEFFTDILREDVTTTDELEDFFKGVMATEHRREMFMENFKMMFNKKDFSFLQIYCWIIYQLHSAEVPAIGLAQISHDYAFLKEIIVRYLGSRELEYHDGANQAYFEDGIDFDMLFFGYASSLPIDMVADILKELGPDTIKDIKDYNMAYTDDSSLLYFAKKLGIL